MSERQQTWIILAVIVILAACTTNGRMVDDYPRAHRKSATCREHHSDCLRSGQTAKVCSKCREVCDTSKTSAWPLYIRVSPPPLAHGSPMEFRSPKHRRIRSCNLDGFKEMR